MRHRKKTAIIGRSKAARSALLRTQAVSLIKNKKITTTEAKTKLLKSYIERLTTKAKKGTLASEREINKKLNNHGATKELIKNIAPKYKDRKGGYTRIVKLGRRKGDGAPVSQIEFI